MSKEVKVDHIPWCDLCRMDGASVPAVYDAKTAMGPWANVCDRHFKSHGLGLGTGLGQKLVQRVN